MLQQARRDNSFSRGEPNTQKLTGFLANLRTFTGFFNWLASLIKPTEEEPKNAGVYLGGEGRG
jgi:hypothetical protein